MPLGRFADLSTGREGGTSRGAVAERVEYWRKRVGAKGRNRGRDRKCE